MCVQTTSLKHMKFYIKWKIKLREMIDFLGVLECFVFWAGVQFWSVFYMVYVPTYLGK